jgi:hypothetical protein
MSYEFKVGDKVTFKPYEKALPATIKAVDIYNGMDKWGQQPDSRIFYSIGGDMCASECTGICIVESKLFESSQ